MDLVSDGELLSSPSVAKLFGSVNSEIAHFSPAKAQPIDDLTGVKASVPRTGEDLLSSFRPEV
jgi:hypothetical protein